MSILLKGRNGNELELAFVREALPDIQDGFGDSAYFTVVWRAAAGDESWEEAAPCVNLFEFHNLADWLESVGGAAEGEVDAVELLEPQLKFAVATQERLGVGIRVAFQLDDRPEEFGVDAPIEGPDSIDLFMERPSILAAAAALRGALEEFDVRNRKDDPSGDPGNGILGTPDENLNLIDRVEKYPPGAGSGVDNAGNS